MDADRDPVGARRGWRRGVPAAMMGVGALAMTVGLLAPSVAAQAPQSITAALTAYSSDTVTIQLTPVASSPNGAWVSIMNPTSGATYTHAFVNQALMAGKQTTITVPVALPGGTFLPGFSSFLEIPASGTQAVVLAAETDTTTPPPIPVPPPTPQTPLSTPPIPSTPPTTYTKVTPPPTYTKVTPPTKTTSTTPSVPVPSVPPSRTVTLPKTGAGPWLEIGGVLLFLAGGFLLVLRPRRS